MAEAQKSNYPRTPSGGRRQGRRDIDNKPERDPLNREAPANLDAEEGILASCILDGGRDVMALCLESKLKPESFFKPAHQIIFEALIKIYDDGREVDEIVLSEHLQRQGQLEQIGGYATISWITNRIETTVHAKHWLEIVRENALLRKLIRSATDIVDKAYQREGDLQLLLEEAEKSIFGISQDRISESARPIGSAVEPAVNLIQRMITQKGQVSGVSSGFRDLDSMTYGFHGQEMIVLAARPSVGKTSFAMNVAENIVMPKQPDAKPVATLVYSLEMSAEQLAMRMLCSHARVNLRRVKDGFGMGAEQQRDLARSANMMKEAPLFIDDSGKITILELSAKARRVHAKNPLGLIVIDYLQLISGTDSRVPREQQIAEISRGIKGLAKELDVPIIVLSQLNRESEKEKRKPKLSDLRESGSIEQDADVVMLLHRELNTDERGVVPGDPGKRELIIAKQRNGPIGEVLLTFIAELTRFENYAREQDEV